MPVPPPWRHDHQARDDRADVRDEDATARDVSAGARDDVADARDIVADVRDEEFHDLESALRRLLTAADRRHSAEDARRDELSRGRPASELTAEQLEIDRETHTSERTLDGADIDALRAGLDWLHRIYLRDSRRDRFDAAGDRASSRTDRFAAGGDRRASEADRQQSTVDEARLE